MGFFLAINWIDLQIPSFALYASIGLFVIGLWDDITPTRPYARLFAQITICIAAILISGLEINSIQLLQWHLPMPNPLDVLLPLFILVGAINAINMVDGMDGLAGGVALIAQIMLSFMLFLVTNEKWFFGLMAIMMGSILGFLKYNSHPARIFMGDAGSNWLGYITGLLLVLCVGEIDFVQGSTISNPSIPLSSALLCVAIPVFDTFGVMVARVWRGQSPMKADQNHFHHFLMDLGFGQRKAVTIIYFIALALSTLGVFPIAYPKYQLGWVPDLALITTATFLVLSKFDQTRLFFVTTIRRFNILEKKKLFGWKAKLVYGWETAHRYAVYMLLLSGVLLPAQPTHELSLISAALAVGILVSMAFKSLPHDFIGSLLIAIAAAIILATNNISPISISLNQRVFDVQLFYNQYFIVLAISTFVYYVITFNRMHLDVNPTDFLLIIIPLLMLAFPEPFQTQYRLGIISARAFILFLCLRTFVLKHHDTMRRASMLATLSLIYIALKGLAGFAFVLK
ncbi:MAG: MraY family glycosyltransferase [Oligoflexus sp.]